MGAVRLVIEELPQGGFVVSDRDLSPGSADWLLCATSTLDEALDFVRLKMRREREAAEQADDTSRFHADALERRVRNQNLDAFKRDMDQGALSREAMTDAVHRRNGMWRV